jgi:hypothetical protein
MDSTHRRLRQCEIRTRLVCEICENLALASGLCQAVGMAEKRTKADRLQRQTEQLEKRVDLYPDEIEKAINTRTEVGRTDRPDPD